MYEMLINLTAKNNNDQFECVSGKGPHCVMKDPTALQNILQIRIKTVIFFCLVREKKHQMFKKSYRVFFF